MKNLLKRVKRISAGILAVMVTVSSIPGDVFAYGNESVTDVSYNEISFDDVSFNDASDNDLKTEEIITDVSSDVSSDVILESEEEQDVSASDEIYEDEDKYSPVGLSYIVDSYDLFTLELSGVTKSGAFYKTTGEDISFSVIYKENADTEIYDLTYEYYYDSTDKREGILGDGFTISKEFVREAESKGKTIYCYIRIKIKSFNLTFDDKNKIVQYWNYIPVETDENGEYQLGDKKTGNAYQSTDGEIIKKYSAGYDSDPFIVSSSAQYNDYYEITGIMVDGKELKPIVDTYKRFGEEKSSMPYYVIENIRKDMVITPIIKAKAVSGNATFDTDISAEHIKLSVSDKYASYDSKAGTYKFKKGVTEFEFTLICDWGYVPMVRIQYNFVINGIESQPFSKKITIDEKKKKVKYTWSGVSASYISDCRLLINEKAVDAHMYASQNNVAWIERENNSKVSLGAYDKLMIRVSNTIDGLPQKMDITDVSVTRNKKNVKDVATIVKESNDSYVLFDASKAENGTKPFVVTVEGTFGIRKLNIDVAKKITFVKVVGANKKNVIKLPAGTGIINSVSVDKGADYGNLLVEYDTSLNCYVEYDKERELLTVETYKSDTLCLEPFDVTFYTNESGERVDIAKFTVEPDFSKLPAPSVKVLSVNDIGMNLKLSASSETQGYKNLYFKVEAKAVGSNVNSKMKSEVIAQYVPYEGNDITWFLNLANSENQGDGAAQKYDIKVSVIQTFKKSSTDNVVRTGTVKTLKNRATKDPAYETKLTLKKVKTSVTIGESDVLLATVKYSGKTTFTSIDHVELHSSNGSYVWNSESYFKTEGNNIYLTSNYVDNIQAGKYKVSVYPELPEDTYCVPATMELTFKAAITNISLSPAGKDAEPLKVYKASGKEASIKIKASCYSYQSGNGKSGSNKVKWEVFALNDNLKKALKIKDGKVTVAKGYKVSEEFDENVFYVYATAADLKNSVQVSEAYVVTKESLSPGSMEFLDASDTDKKIRGVTKNPAGNLQTEYQGKVLRLYDTKGNLIDLSEVSLSVTPAKGFSINKEGIPEITKIGTYTVKVTRNDGSKRSLSMKFKVKSPELDEAVPYSASFTNRMLNGSKAEITFASGKATVSGTELISVRVSALDVNGDPVDSLYDNKATVSVTGGIIRDTETEKKSGDKLYYIDPVKNKLVVKLSYKGKKGKKITEEYEIDIADQGGKLIPAKNYSGYAHSYDESLYFKIETKDLDLSSYKPEDLSFNAFCDEKMLKKKTTRENAESLCKIIRLYSDISLEENAVKIYPESLGWIDKGEYSIYISLWDKGSGLALTAPVKVNFSIKNAPKSSVSLESTVYVSKEDLETDIQFKTFKNCGGICITIDGAKSPTHYGELECFNDNEKGVVNNFTDYYEVYLSKETSGKQRVYLRKRTGKEIPEGITSITGWVRYAAVGKDFSTTVIKTEKIKVIIK